VGALYERIPSAPVRLLWWLIDATPLHNYDVLNHFAFEVMRPIGWAARLKDWLASWRGPRRPEPIRTEEPCARLHDSQRHHPVNHECIDADGLVKTRRGQHG
jgi:hypothetical protein